MDAIISHGCFLRECSVKHSIVGERSRLDYGVELKVSSYYSHFPSKGQNNGKDIYIYIYIYIHFSVLTHPMRSWIEWLTCFFIIFSFTGYLDDGC